MDHGSKKCLQLGSFLDSRYEILVVQLHRYWISVDDILVIEPTKVSAFLTVTLSCLGNFWG